ncbi:MAG TPA: hypothetical protein VFK40_05665 [Nitrososphaeraceae archaeon]|nr:hypothetical protein [Nitrososphaeraceae archaeon]
MLPTVAPKVYVCMCPKYLIGKPFSNDDFKDRQNLDLTVNENGTVLANEPEELFPCENRYHGLAFDQSGKTIYVITDIHGPAKALMEM